MSTPKPSFGYPRFRLPLDPVNIPIRRCQVPFARAGKRILIMRLGAFGDILMGTPTLRAIRDAYPDAHITWAVEHSELDAVFANPYVDDILVWDTMYWKRMLRRALYPLWAAHALKFGSEIRSRHYDIFISYQPEEWALLTRAISAPLKIGVFDTFRRFYGGGATSANVKLFDSFWTHNELPNHRIDQYLLALEPLQIPHPDDKKMAVGYTFDDETSADQFLLANGIAGGDDFVVIAPMTTWPTKCWPVERYAELAKRIIALASQRVVLVGSAKERAVIEQLNMSIGGRGLVMAGELSFRGMAALMSKAKLLISGDTGSMHVAGAVGTPQVAIFGATSAEWYGPLTGSFRAEYEPVPCGPCDQKVCKNSDDEHLMCLKLVGVQSVFQSCIDLLGAKVEAVSRL